MFEYEARFGSQHLLRNVAFVGRTTQEVSRQRDYWNPWLTMQILSHASPAILNHPFLHLVVLRSRDAIRHSRLFLQQTVDLTLYHTGWVFQLIRSAEGLVEIVDPLLGEIAAAVVTIPWVFQFAKDGNISKKAQEDIATCETFLSRLALTWPHIAHKVRQTSQLASAFLLILFPA